MPADQKQEIEEKARELFRGQVDEAGHVRYTRNAAILRGVRKA